MRQPCWCPSGIESNKSSNVETRVRDDSRPLGLAAGAEILERWLLEGVGNSGRRLLNIAVSEGTVPTGDGTVQALLCSPVESQSRAVARPRQPSADSSEMWNQLA